MTPEEKQQRAWRKLNREMVMSITQPYEALYERTNNPILLFEAYRTARAAKVEIPDWVLEGLDAWAQVLCVERPRGKDNIVKALGLTSGGGGPSVSSQVETQLRDLAIVQRIDTLMKAQNITLDRAFAKATKKYNLSYDSVRDIWYRLTRIEAS